MVVSSLLSGDYPVLLEEIKGRTRAARYETLKPVNKELIALYWDFGRMIAERRKDSGGVKSVVEKLAADLENEFPGMWDFSGQNLRYMCQLCLTYDENPKLQPPVGENGRCGYKKKGRQGPSRKSFAPPTFWSGTGREERR